MKKFQFKLEFNEEKIKAIKVSLKDKNKDLDEEIIKFLNGLYNKNVPKLLKKYIEGDFQSEDKSNEEVEELQKEAPKDFQKSDSTLENNHGKY